jgi:hypothetical protein
LALSFSCFPAQNSCFREDGVRWRQRHSPPGRAWRAGAAKIAGWRLPVGSLGESVSDADEIVADDAEPDPAPHPVVALVPAAIEPVAPLDYADTALRSGAPLLAPFVRLSKFARSKIVAIRWFSKVDQQQGNVAGGE